MVGVERVKDFIEGSRDVQFPGKGLVEDHGLGDRAIDADCEERGEKCFGGRLQSLVILQVSGIATLAARKFCVPVTGRPRINV